MGLDFPLYSIKNCSSFIKEINNFLSKGLDSRFKLVKLQLFLTAKWKFDCIICRKTRKEKTMSNFMSTYIPKYVPSDLKWYERDGLLTWYGERGCEDFLRDTDGHFKQAKIINFIIIHRECRGEEVPKDVLVGDNEIMMYQVIQKMNQKKLFSSAFRTDRQDIYFENNTIEKHFENRKRELDQKSFFSKKN